MVDFAELMSVEQPRFKMQAIAQAINPSPVTEQPKEQKKRKQEQEPDAPSNQPVGWIPKKEYMAKLAAEKAANERIANADEKGVGARQPSRRRIRSRSQKRKSARLERSPVRETMMTICQRRRN